MVELLELADARADLGAAAFDELQNVCARRRSEISDSDHIAYLSNGQPDCLGGADECQALQHLSRVLTIARRRPHSLGQQPGFLVKAQRGRSQAAATGQFADFHTNDQYTLTLECTPSFMLWRQEVIR